MAAVGCKYNITDHLGNVRAEITPYIGAPPLVTQARNYYTFGMEMSQLNNNGSYNNRYLYNGKELQNDFGLYWYDYGARFYDPMVGRWHTQDPMAEKYYNSSPYNYVGNNPISRIDPNGMDWYYYKDGDGNEHYQYSDGSDKTIQVGDITYSNIGSTVSIKLNDDVYLNAFQNLTMQSLGEEVNLKNIILNDQGLFNQYIKNGSDLSMQGRVELFGSYIGKKIGEDGSKVLMGIAGITGSVIGIGELAGLAPLLGDAAMNQLAIAEFYTGNISMLQNSTYAVGAAMNNTQTGQWLAALLYALAPEGTQPGYPINDQKETITKWLKQCFDLREHTKKSDKK